MRKTALWILATVIGLSILESGAYLSTRRESEFVTVQAGILVSVGILWVGAELAWLVFSLLDWLYREERK